MTIKESNEDLEEYIRVEGDMLEDLNFANDQDVVA